MLTSVARPSDVISQAKSPTSRPGPADGGGTAGSSGGWSVWTNATSLTGGRPGSEIPGEVASAARCGVERRDVHRLTRQVADDQTRGGPVAVDRQGPGQRLRGRQPRAAVACPTVVGDHLTARPASAGAFGRTAQLGGVGDHLSAAAR